MCFVTTYALARATFGAASAIAPSKSGMALAGEGGAAPDARAFLRGMGARDIGLGFGLLAAARAGAPVRPWLVALILADAGDVAGILDAWPDMPPCNRWFGLSMAVGAAAGAAAALLASR